MQTLEQMQTAAFQIISYSGDARSSYLEAIREAREGNFERAEELIKIGEKAYHEIHQVHFSLIQKEANGETLPFSLLFMHAEDQMLTTETIKLLALEMIQMCKFMRER
ncbi:PTS lactose/cellobiose transporter subunit IIA [Paenactinomyces guangxiensis]|uniref:PTS lactose/cellobiose transporter subunit IIA n=1 Tax=Paenactinomyces guangxiensis TaxID=1490290 RepID=A0A7W1WQ19_9BACL|nr:PTS lactose/cellobiose transporter subunit IIA [Paenactinomyces guangxiensis]MBA4493973.1 PTS lactose/cellobiose transporter subunit IIA [Paenactinomyces guangxiensis]MBH8593394.1 PTS lactose/cellobiose transporter subunit IIA [Paenactinomyces guangxiensis]